MQTTHPTEDWDLEYRKNSQISTAKNANHPIRKWAKQEQPFHERGSAMVDEQRGGCSTGEDSHQANAKANHSEIL